MERTSPVTTQPVTTHWQSFPWHTVALSVCKRSTPPSRMASHSHCQSPQQCLSQRMPHPMKIRYIPFKVQIGHNLIKSFCFNLSVRHPGTAGTSHTHTVKPERPCEESSPPHYVQVAVELLIWHALHISLTSIPVSHSFDHGIAYISEIVNSESTKLMQPINRKDRSPVVKKLASSRQEHGTGRRTMSSSESSFSSSSAAAGAAAAAAASAAGAAATANASGFARYSLTYNNVSKALEEDPSATNYLLCTLE